MIAFKNFFYYLYEIWAISSVGPERSPHTRKVAGSNPALPTNCTAPINWYQIKSIIKVKKH